MNNEIIKRFCRFKQSLRVLSFYVLRIYINFLGLEGVEIISSIKFIGSVTPQSGLFAWGEHMQILSRFFKLVANLLKASKNDIS